MKIRKGFVSNSSTSSFLLIGVCVDHDDITKKAKVDRDDFDLDETMESLGFDSNDFVSDDDIVYVGNVLAYGEDCDAEIELDKLVADEKANRAAAVFGKKPKLYAGIVSC